VTEIEGLEARIRKAVLKMREKGWEIVAGTNGSNLYRTCCPLRACVLAEGGGYGMHSEVLKIPHAVVLGFINGFDGTPKWGDEDDYAYALGQTLRAEWIE